MFAQVTKKDLVVYKDWPSEVLTALSSSLLDPLLARIASPLPPHGKLCCWFLQEVQALLQLRRLRELLLSLLASRTGEQESETPPPSV